MKSFIVSIILTLTFNLCLGQAVDKTAFPNGNYIYITSKKKVILNGEKSSLHKLKLYLKETDERIAKIGTVKPTPLPVFAIFEEVVQLCEKYNIEAIWFRDQAFTIPFFDEE